ncbi:MAG: hypothetical protein H3C48_02380 [Chitinophagaceae bacterium]|nr:hypothetical protein [Chitinophagaceae bacterium]
MAKFLNRLFSEYIFYIIVILFSAQSANFLENKLFLIFAFGLSVFYYFRKYKRITKPFEVLLIVWLSINLIAYLTFGNEPNVKFITFFSVTARMLLPYFFVRLLGSRFFIKMERIIFYLSLISLPIFLVQYFKPEIFYGISSTLNYFTIDEQKANGGWYIGVYMFNGWAPDRNSGFMWEPGAFSFMMLMALIFRLINNNSIFDSHVFAYIAGIITTFSTMGYIVLFFVLAAVFVKRTSVVLSLIFLPIILIIGYSIYSKVDFLGPKIEQYTKEMDRIGRSNEMAGGALRVNRFAILNFAVKESIKWPLGYGILEDTPSHLTLGERLSGSNTLAHILLRWGWVGIILFFISVRKFVFKYFDSNSFVSKTILITAILFSVSTYSLLNNTFLLSILYLPYIKLRFDDKLRWNSYSKQRKLLYLYYYKQINHKAKTPPILPVDTRLP